MEGKKNKNGLLSAILRITTIPILMFAIVVVMVGSAHFNKAMYREVQNELKGVGAALLMMYDMKYPGDYELVEEETAEGIGYGILKGSHRLNHNYTIIDELKEKTHMDFTFFYGDTRIITTIKDEKGNRIIATGASPVVLKDVLYTGKEHFYNDAAVITETYFAYYAPLLHSDGSCVGMVAVGKPVAQVREYVRKSLIPVWGIGALGMLTAGAFSAAYTKRLISAIRILEKFIWKVERGNLTAELDRQVLDRNDEMGEMGRSVMNMQKELRGLIEMDTLTRIYNRRYGEKRLEQVRKSAQTTGMLFCIGLGDIDFFKRVNDTYGHECGDFILKNVALHLKKHMTGNGIVARWGGEEFLVIYEREGVEEAREKLRKLLEELRGMQFRYGEETLGVTMTFGLLAGDTEDFDGMLRKADQLLYEGKTGGRDRVVG